MVKRVRFEVESSSYKRLQGWIKVYDTRKALKLRKREEGGEAAEVARAEVVNAGDVEDSEIGAPTDSEIGAPTDDVLQKLQRDIIKVREVESSANTL